MTDEGDVVGLVSLVDEVLHEVVVEVLVVSDDGEASFAGAKPGVEEDTDLVFGKVALY